MTITGDYLRREYGLNSRRTTKLSDILQIIKPNDVQMTFKSMSMYLNCLFIFQLKQLSTRMKKAKDDRESVALSTVGLKGSLAINF
jgi:hypothetical protein